MSNDNKQLSIIFMGDIALNDDYNNFYISGRVPFAEVRPILSDADFVVGNLECFARGSKGTNPLRECALGAEPETLNYLSDLNLGLVGLANNHAYDNLDDGFSSTISILDAFGVKHIGASQSGNESQSFILDKSGIRVGILNYVAKDTHPRPYPGASILLNWFDNSKAANDIAQLKKDVDIVIVFPHWGGKMEGSMFPDKDLISTARNLIDAGADLIVGHHSHTLQPYEIYRGKYIYYSLGNFCFSDVYKKGQISQADYKRTRSSALLRVVINEDGYKVDCIGIRNTGELIVPDYGGGGNKCKKLFPRYKWLYCKPVWYAYNFYEKNVYKIVRYFFSNNRNPLRQLLKVKPAMFLKTLSNLRKTFVSKVK